jgi:hypothetical protein
MTLALRIILVVASVFVTLYALRKIRKAQLNIDDAFYWIIVSCILLVMSIFPVVPAYLSSLIGIESPANFVFLVMIFLAFVKMFSLSIEFSVQKYRLNKLVQKIALNNHVCEDSNKENN